MLSDFSGELATLLERDESGRMQAPRLRRFERRAINRFAFRRDRRAWAWLALLLQAQFAATRRAQPDLDVHCFLAERTAPATLPR